MYYAYCFIREGKHLPFEMLEDKDEIHFYIRSLRNRYPEIHIVDGEGEPEVVVKDGHVVSPADWALEDIRERFITSGQFDSEAFTAALRAAGFLESNESKSYSVRSAGKLWVELYQKLNAPLPTPKPNWIQRMVFRSRKHAE